MDIPYQMRSSFLAEIEVAIRANGRPLPGASIRIRLKPGGYTIVTTITVRSNDATHFGSSWNGKPEHISRFSSRVNATAMALRRLGYYGTYRVAHEDGNLELVATRV